MKKIRVFEEFSAEERMTRIGGERLRQLIQASVKHQVAVEIQFDGRAIASVSFLDEGLAKLLMEGWTAKSFKQQLHLVELHPRDRKILDDLLKERSKKR